MILTNFAQVNIMSFGFLLLFIASLLSLFAWFKNFKSAPFSLHTMCVWNMSSWSVMSCQSMFCSFKQTKQNPRFSNSAGES